LFTNVPDLYFSSLIEYSDPNSAVYGVRMRDILFRSCRLEEVRQAHTLVQKLQQVTANEKILRHSCNISDPR
jgi:hypothetical protein